MPVTIQRTSWAENETALRSIREAVFIREQRVPESLEWDEHDQQAVHFLALGPGGIPAGCIRLLPTGQLSRLAVLEQFRNQDIGSALLSAAEAEARSSGMDEIFLHAQTQATHFYENAGFTVSGGIFLEADIPHRQMFKELGH
ncbi:GNAT family N-acetyltransferase [Alcanivorax sp. 1008]|nr:GNAT family N-acetyltransferase [Alcanivorax sp. 1008]MCC1497793.1 GNAT family N-acetyltransferase [Alcanivorax sp. 1008]